MLRTFLLLTLLQWSFAIASAWSQALPDPVRSAGVTVEQWQVVQEALYAASATQAAMERDADSQIRAAQAEIARLRAQGANTRQALAAAQEAFVSRLAQRDHAYAQEISVFRAAVSDIASTPEGVAALARFNDGDEVGAIAVLDQLRSARDRARQIRANIESAAEARRIAELALEAHNRSRLDTSAVVARLEEVTRLDPSVTWDWIELCRLYADQGQLRRALGAARTAASVAIQDRDKSVSLSQAGDIQLALGDLDGARESFQAALVIDEQIALSSSDADVDAQRDVPIGLSRLGDIGLAQGNPEVALGYYVQAGEMDRLHAQQHLYPRLVLDVCVDGVKIADALVASGDLPRARTQLEAALGCFNAFQEQDIGVRFLGTEYTTQFGFARWKYANVRAAQGDVSFAANEFQSLRSLASQLEATDPSNRLLQAQAEVLEISLADADILLGREASARARLSRALRTFADIASESDQSIYAFAGIWLAQTRLAALGDRNIAWASLAPDLPRVRMRGDLSALDWYFIGRVRDAAQQH